MVAIFRFIESFQSSELKHKSKLMQRAARMSESLERMRCRGLRPFWRQFRRHDDAGRQIADSERRGDQIICEHENVKRVKKIEVNALIIEQIKGEVLEAIAIEQIPHRREMAAIIKSEEAVIVLLQPFRVKIANEATREVNRKQSEAIRGKMTSIETRLADLGTVPMPLNAQGFADFIAAESEKWGKVVRIANIGPQ